MRLDDVRQLLRLLEECREIAAGGDAPARHFLDGLARITRSAVAIQMDASGIRPDAPPTVERIRDVGWTNDSDRDRIYTYVAAQPLDSDPITRELLKRPERIATLTRSNAVGFRDWSMSEVRNDVHRASAIDDSLLSMARKGGGSVSVIALKRAWGEPPFGDDERELLELAHGECTWIFRDAVLSAPLDIHWSPRERETLGLLLTGRSEKSIAATLKLSPHTVHDYVKVIFRKVGVASRAELMARALSSSGPPRDREH